MDNPVPRNAADQNFNFGLGGGMDDSRADLDESYFKLPKSIVVMTWGALAWDPGDLPLVTEDPEHGTPVTTLFARSRRNDLDAAIRDLMAREGSSNPKRIGFVDVKDDRHRCRLHPGMAEAVKEWAKTHSVDCVIWTELPSNFKDHTGRDFSVENAINYLRELPKALVTQAREYVDRAPAEIDTPLRAKLRDEGWPE